MQELRCVEVGPTVRAPGGASLPPDGRVIEQPTGQRERVARIQPMDFHRKSEEDGESGDREMEPRQRMTGRFVQ